MPARLQPEVSVMGRLQLVQLVRVSGTFEQYRG